MVPGLAPRRAASLPAAHSPSPATRAAAPRAAPPPPRRYPAAAAPRRAPRAVAAGAMAADASPTPAAAGTNGAPKAQLSVAIFSVSDYVLDFLEAPFAAAFSRTTFIPHRFDAASAPLAAGHDAVCLFVNDDADAAAIDALADAGVKFIAMRCAGFDRVDLAACARRGLRVLRVPAYSPRSVAEMALALALAAARHLKAANARVGVGNFGLSGIVGLELSGKTYGVVGTGAIGLEFVKLLRGFDGRVLAHDVRENAAAIAAGAEYVDLDTLLRESDVVSLHTPLLPSTKHIMCAKRLALMKPEAILVNVSRGGLIDTAALLRSLKTLGRPGAVALDVYEAEGSLFFQDFSNLAPAKRMAAWDSAFTELHALPQVLATPHVAFLTKEALANIAETTVENLRAAAAAAPGAPLPNEVEA